MKMLPESIRKRLGLRDEKGPVEQDRWMPVCEHSHSRKLSAPARWLCGVTDIGQRRRVNEDEYFLSPDCTFWVVADGMGGHAAGAVASALTIHAIVAYFFSKGVAADGECLADARLIKAFSSAQESVSGLSQNDA